MATCPQCKHYFRELPDEQGDHGCPKCGLPPFDARRKTMTLDEIDERAEATREAEEEGKTLCPVPVSYEAETTKAKALWWIETLPEGNLRSFVMSADSSERQVRQFAANTLREQEPYLYRSIRPEQIRVTDGPWLEKDW